MSEIAAALLLRTGAATKEQVQAALRLAAQGAGTFTECIVRTGAIDESRLAELFHKRLMIPRVSESRLERVAQEVLDLVPPEMAIEFRVVPVEMDAEGLLLAMADPSDNHAVEEVQFFAGNFILRSVAGESAIRRALIQHYGAKFTPAPKSAVSVERPSSVQVAVVSPPAEKAPAPQAPAPQAQAPAPAPQAPAPQAAQPAPVPQAAAPAKSSTQRGRPLAPDHRPDPRPVSGVLNVSTPPPATEATGRSIIIDEDLREIARATEPISRPVVLLPDPNGPPVTVPSSERDRLERLGRAPTAPQTPIPREPPTDEIPTLRRGTQKQFPVAFPPANEPSNVASSLADLEPPTERMPKPPAMAPEEPATIQTPTIAPPPKASERPTERIKKPTPSAVPEFIDEATNTSRVSMLPEPPLERLRKAQKRDDISGALLDYIAQLTKRCVFFGVKRAVMQGLDARGGGLSALKVSQIALTIDAQSVFRDVIAYRLPYRGPLLPGALNDALAAALGGVGAEILIMPVSVRVGQEDKTVGVLFGDTPLATLPDAAIHATVREAGAAFERVLKQKKSG